MRGFAVEPNLHESFGTPSEGVNLSTSVVVFAPGARSAYDGEVSDRLLDLRPGLLVIFRGA